MNSQEYAKLENEMLNETGINITGAIKEHPQLCRFRPEGYVNRLENMLYDEIRKYNKHFDKTEMTEESAQEFKRALKEQILYTLTVGDYSLMSGYDPTVNSITSLSEIRKRALSPEAKKILTDAGLFYRGLRRRLTPYEEWRLRGL